MRAWIAGTIMVALFALGCAATQQAAEDYNLGKPSITPIAEGENAPAQEAQQVIDLLRAVPVVGNYAGVALPVLVGFFTWRRGRRIRKAIPPSTNPITGPLLAKVGIGKANTENLVQSIVDIFRGIYDWLPEESGLRRGFKVVISVVLAALAGAILIPGVREWVFANLGQLATVTGLAGLLGGLEKKLQIVKPVVEPPSS